MQPIPEDGIKDIDDDVDEDRRNPDKRISSTLHLSIFIANPNLKKIIFG